MPRKLIFQGRFSFGEYGEDSEDGGAGGSWHNFWRNGSGINRNSVYLNWNDVESYLNDNWYNPTNQWDAGNVFPVASSVIYGDLFASRRAVCQLRLAAG